MLENSRVAAQLAVSQDELSSTDLVNLFLIILLSRVV
jgi:hypothetical protein